MSLPRLDFSAISHNAAKWPLPGKVLLGCALGGVVLMMGEFFYLGQAREQLHAAQVQEAALQQQYAERAGLAAGLEEHTRRFRVMEQRAAGLAQQLPAESEVPGLLEDIARLAAANGLVVENVTVLDERPLPFYIEQPLQIGAVGVYPDLAMFVSALGGLSRIVTAHDVVLRSDGPLLRLELLAKTYRAASARAVEQGRRVVYDAPPLRNPFQSPALQSDRPPGKPASAPDPARARGALERLAIDQFEMVGTLSRGTQVFALLRVASAVHRLAVGDYLGPNHGRVTAIHESYIELAELFPDEQGAWLERSRTLVLNVTS